MIKAEFMLSIKNLLIFICVCFTSIAVSQIDTNREYNKGNTIRFKAAVKTTEKPNELIPSSTIGFEKAYREKQKNLQKKRKQEEKENKEILTPELKRKIQFNKFVEKNTLRLPKINMDIGSFETKSEDLILYAFDFGEFDGDKVSVVVNGKSIYNNILLTKNTRSKYTIPLKIGFNVVEILAINEGKYRPNTGAFTLVDNFNNKVFSDLWQLVQGAKVIAHVIRINPDK